ncbi:hypothetical protein I302_100956 [Kwoniella bestiolae CBS 10118]|uniref:Uncharacterized protein n=1 Tax=Kwoniella bestiolae CBS 10118 TaxID=1296100 RepID=A0A1B9G6I4_9TREE|nr:hypothetical protein I302_04333 [Kwoniella bestiolae CBS 10118]OCF26647.1 hypothetical protein I302_04333 [Kwoniella bestiolae CBS 10118]
MSANVTSTSSSGHQSTRGKPPKLMLQLTGTSTHPSASPGDPSEPEPLGESDDNKKGKYIIYRCLDRGLTYCRKDGSYRTPNVTLPGAPSCEESNDVVEEYDHYFKETVGNVSDETKTFRDTLRSEFSSKYNQWTLTLENPMVKASEAFKRYTEIYQETCRDLLVSWTTDRVKAFRADRTDNQDFEIEFVDKKPDYVRHIPTCLHSEVPEAIKMNEYVKGVNDHFEGGSIRASILSRIMQ